jgi:site-specific DNA recombinase
VSNQFACTVEEKIMKQAAIYARVSTQQQKEGATIESQKDLLHQFAKEKGFEIIPEWVFEDNGISGSTLARPGLDKLRDFASEGLLDVIFILSPDRLSRKFAYQAILMEEFKGNSVEVIFQNSPTPTTPTENLLLQMQGMFAEYERAQITERSRRGKKHKAKNGEVSVLSHAPYGYKYISGTDGIKPFFDIVDKEASVVRSIYDLYVKKRFSIEKIRAYLTNQQIRSAKGHIEWHRSSIRGILKNSAYRGVAYYGKMKKGDYNSTRLPCRSIRLNGRRTAPRGCYVTDQKEWIEIPVPAIIENDIFEIAQELMKKNKKMSIRNSKPGSLLQGLISCAECGYGFITATSGKNVNGYRYYRCSKRDKKCTNHGIRTEILDQEIWNSLISILKSPDLIQKEVSRRISELEKTPIRQRQNLLKGKLEQLERESNLLLDAYQSECIDLSELKARMAVLKKQQNNFTREIKEIESGSAIPVEHFSRAI